MKRSVMGAILVMIVILLMLAGCADEKVLRPGQTATEQAATPASVKPTQAAPTQTTKANAVPKAKPTSDDDERPVPGPYDVLYCNLLEIEMRSDLENAEKDLKNTQGRLDELQSEIEDEAGENRNELRKTEGQVKNTITILEKNLQNIKDSISSMTSKCSVLDDGKKTSCDAFNKDLSVRLSAAQKDLLEEQTKIRFITDSTKLIRQQRKILAAQLDVEKHEAVRDDLAAHC